MNYNQIYKNNSEVWGSRPNKLLQKIYNQADAGSEFLDLGCGQGRDSLFMLKKGFKVTAVDSSREGINKVKESVLASNLSALDIFLLCEDIKNFKIEKNKYGIINVFNSLQFLLRQDGLKLIEKIKSAVPNKGFVIISGFTTDDPSYNGGSCYLKPRELKKLFSGFNLIFYHEKEMPDKGHAGKPEPHKHHVVEMIARK
ncbi:MAG: methyltransferase domain-containing protein [Patescibacteria group bacterium]|nr:methyltransferase domain-containing protein [Patescibacteria group bacterium]